ncbi:hypothetical protein ACWDA9_20980, partial [Streptomyces sp. NPDC001193]
MPISYTDQQIREKAASLGLIQEGADLPRQLRGKVVAAMAYGDAAERHQAPEPQRVGEIVMHGLRRLGGRMSFGGVAGGLDLGP